MICLRMDSRVIKRIVCPMYAQKARALFVCLLTEPFHLKEFLSGSIWSVKGPVFYDILGK